MDGPKENRAAIINEEGWEEWLLELLLDGSPCIPTADEQVSLHHFPLQSVDLLLAIGRSFQKLRLGVSHNTSCALSKMPRSGVR